MVDLVSLTPATIYYVWVRSLCSPSDISSWSSSLSFVTECVAVTSFTENFDSALAFPTCWGKVGIIGTANIQTADPSSAPNTLYMVGYGTTPVVKTILVSNLGAGTNRLKFDMRANFTLGGIIEIGYLSNPNDATTFTVLNSVTANSFDYTQFIFSPPVGVYSEYLALRHTGTPGNSVLIDNVVWEANPATVPTCASGISATINPTCGNFATEITWTAATDADGYKLNIGTTSGGTDIMNNQIVGNVLTYSFVGNANTTYFYTVLPYNFVGNAVGCSEQSLTTFATGCFCDSFPTSNDAAGITNVQLGTTDFPNGDVTYFDNTATPVSFARGINTNLQVSFATGYTYGTNVWIDFNDNLTFESSEIVYTGVSLSTNPTVLNASFIMPTLATLGSHRMRIGTADVGQLIPDPCYSGTYGVTLDYTVTIIDASCTPAAGVASLSPDCTNNQFFVNVNVTALGSGTPSISNGTTTWPITSIGNVQVGPFANGTSSNALEIVHGSDSTCDLPLGTFTYSCPPSNDECSGARVLTPGGTFATYPQTGTILVATTTAGITPSCQATVSADVWYSVVVPASGSITIETQAAATNTMTDSVIVAFSGTCGQLTAVGCSDDILVGTNNYSKVSLTGQTAGATLYVGVWKYAVAAPTSTNSGFQIAAYDGSLSTNTFNSAAFTYYPNPVKNTLNLSYSENISDVSVYNLLGQQVFAKAVNANQSQIDMSHLTSGTYMVKVTANNQVKIIKVIKE
jgi:hypothetical protein